MIVVQLATGDVLLLILQRYYFESESQHMRQWNTINQGCCLSYKDTILKANHSSTSRSISKDNAVAYPTKILFWKRITAADKEAFESMTLLLILQRYYFESESQLLRASAWNQLCCCLSYKDTILKANHSTILYIQIAEIAVAYPTKILFWKRITALSYRDTFSQTLLLILHYKHIPT